MNIYPFPVFIQQTPTTYQMSQTRPTHPNPSQVPPQQPSQQPYQPREKRRITITDDDGNDVTSSILNNQQQNHKEAVQPTGAINVPVETPPPAQVNNVIKSGICSQ